MVERGHGTEVAGIVGANNISAIGSYIPPQMNGILSGLPSIPNAYTLEERSVGAYSLAEQVAAVHSAIRARARVVLIETEVVKCAALSTFQNNNCPKNLRRCADSVDMIHAYRVWYSVFQNNGKVLFILPGGNFNVEVPVLTTASDTDAAQAETLVGGLAPGETKKIHGKIYLLPNDVDGLLKRYRADFPNP